MNLKLLLVAIKITHLSCAGLDNPIGLDDAHPSFSWNVEGAGTQKAYQLIVATNPGKLDPRNADVWNSGKTISGNSLWITYAGKTLTSRNKYYWKVLVWTAGKATPEESDVASFTTGLMHKEDWKAKWIGLDTFYAGDRPTDVYSRLSARYFRKSFVSKQVKSAYMYFTGLGLYKLYINGKKIGDEELAPSATDFSKRVYYNAFDVTKDLSAGNNTIGVILGNGRFFSLRPGKAGVWKEGIPAIRNFGYPKLIAQLEITYTDGTKQTILSDSSWKVTADGPIRANNEYDGESYDMTKAMPGWSTSSFSDQKWQTPALATAPGGELMRQPNPNMKIMKILKPLTISKLGNKRFIVDMGQNMVGWVAIKVQSTPNQPIVLKYAEKLKRDDSLYTANLRSAKVTDSILVPSVAATVDYHPSFVYHGFRYVEVSGVENLQKENIEGQVVYDDMTATGNFRCSDTMLNKIYQAAWWTICGNYKGMPVDCPQRDERMGWLGDRSINSFGESFLFDNYHVYSKWVDDIADAQLENGSIPDVAPSYWWPFLSDNMTWPSSYLFVSQMLYQQFGDRNIIVRHYSRMKKWMEHMRTFFNSDSLLDRDNYGDWCVPPESKEMIFSKDSTRQAPKAFIASSYYVYCLQMMESFAVLSGHPDDSVAYSNLRSKMIAKINEKYWNKAEGYYANNTITSNLFALSFGIAPPANKRLVADNIVKVSAEKFDNHLGTGLVGNQWLMRGLTDNGYADVAFRIATNKTYPSWGYMLENGATTIWELWNGNTANPAMNSGNHVMLLGDLIIWYFERLAGIKASEPGFKKIEMKPLIDQPLTFVDAKHVSPYGEIKSSWKKENGAFKWNITIPGNTSAIAYVPAVSKGSIKIAAEARYIGKDENNFVFELLPGQYTIESKIKTE